LPQETQPTSDTEIGQFRQEYGAGGRAVQHILVVEDSPTMRALLSSALEELGTPVKITEANSGFEALRCLPRQSFDLIVTDINMPDINGLELVSFVKNNDAYRSIPLLIVSTESSARDREKGVGLGADGYIVKPFDRDDLREVVIELLSRSRRNE
jgi:two-component system chemotaxis response regulator CheY